MTAVTHVAGGFAKLGVMRQGQRGSGGTACTVGRWHPREDDEASKQPNKGVPSLSPRSPRIQPGNLPLEKGPAEDHEMYKPLGRRRDGRRPYGCRKYSQFVIAPSSAWA